MAEARDPLLIAADLLDPPKSPKRKAWEATARPNQLTPPGDWFIWYVQAGRGFGKALALDTPIPTPTGWTTMGEIQVGAEVYDESGRPCRVVETSPVYLDHPCYRVRFDDGSEIVADAGHRWLTWDKRARKAWGRARNPRSGPEVRTTREIADTLMADAREHNHSILMRAQANRTMHRYIVACDPVPSVPVRCIAVDSPSHLFLAGRTMIPTHNTRTGAEDVAEYGRTHPHSRIALVAETFADGRDTMVEGVAGMLAVLDESELRGGSREKAWNRSMGELFLANGTKYKVYSSEKPGQLRGPAHDRAWCDELAKFRDAHKGTADDTTWSNLLLGLRNGPDPRVVVTTTPKGYELPRQVKALPGVHLTRGTTYENIANLAPAFKRTVIAMYEGTRLGRQELMAEDLDEAEGSLWTHDAAKAQDKGLIVYGEPPYDARALRKLAEDTGRTLEALMAPEALYDRLAAADFLRAAIGVDPAVTSGPDADETGLVIGALASDGKAYVLDDRSLRASPAEWAQRIISSFDDFRADRIVAEVNNGGELVTTVIRTIRPTAPITAVHASKGKRTRAEPASHLYQLGKVVHLRPFPELESQMTTWEPGSGEASPDRMDALVWLLYELMLSGNSGRVVQGPDIWG